MIHLLHTLCCGTSAPFSLMASHHRESMMNAGPHAIPAPHPENYAETFNAVPNRKYDCIGNSCFSHSRCPHRQFHASYASDSLVFPIPDARTTNFMLPMHRKLLFFLFSMPAPPISCFLCIGFSCFSYSRCPYPPISHFLSIGFSCFSYSRCPLHKTCLTLTAYRLSSPSYIDLIGMSTAITSVPTISAINTMISGSIAASTLWVVISTSSS